MLASFPGLRNAEFAEPLGQLQPARGDPGDRLRLMGSGLFLSVGLHSAGSRLDGLDDARHLVTARG
jgi:hypothetical protein